jgi:hypothetical protein
VVESQTWFRYGPAGLPFDMLRYSGRRWTGELRNSCVEH